MCIYFLAFAYLSKRYRYRMTADQLQQSAKKEVEEQVKFDTVDNYKTKAWKLCKEYLTGRWKTLEEKEFRIKRIRY